jgi:hypothetical protein
MLADAGAAGVLVVATDAVPWGQLREAANRTTTRLASAKPVAPVTGFLSPEAAAALFQRAGRDGAALSEAAKAPGYKGALLPATATIAATATVRAYESNNIIAKLPGAKPDGKAVLFLGHWDHLGICAPDDPKDRICNGAVDNASGIAVLIAVAKRLAGGARPDRDIYFMRTVSPIIRSCRFPTSPSRSTSTPSPYRRAAPRSRRSAAASPPMTRWCGRLRRNSAAGSTTTARPIPSSSGRTAGRSAPGA